MKKMKRPFTLSPILIIILLAGAYTVFAQEDASLRLTLHRDFGYGSGASIQGNFSMRIDDEPADLMKVTFFIDEVAIGEDSEVPFRVDFQTGDYEPGMHTLAAIGTSNDGREITSNQLRREFLSDTQAFSNTSWLVGIIIAISIGGRLLVHWITNRGRQKQGVGEIAIEGPLGGTICPKCQRPFARHWWGLNIGIGKYDRCPHCGKWSIVRRVSQALLEASAAASKAADEQTENDEESEAEALKRRLDDSRYSE